MEAGASTACARDADCVPASCCHATACVHVSRAPACAGIMCTADVQPGTLDMGRCVCRAGKCAAEITKQEDLLHPQ
jgi:hypothetical protein